MAAALCLSAFGGYVGATPSDSTLDLIFFYPPPSAWAQDDRSITCAVFREDGRQLINSVKGSGI